VSRRGLRIVGIAYLVLAGIISFSLAQMPIWIAQANCDRITPGMSREEVYEILGRDGWRPDCGVGATSGEEPVFWISRTYSIRIDFDSNGRVIRVQNTLR